MSSLTVVQAIINNPTMKDHADMIRQRARLATKAIATFNAHASDGQEYTSSYNLSVPIGTTYFSDVVARHAREHQGIRHDVVRIVNESGILMVSQIGGNIIQIVLHYVMMDLGVHPIMIGKKIAYELQLTADDLTPCPFTIVTSIGHVKQTTSYTRESLQLSFHVKIHPHLSFSYMW